METSFLDLIKKQASSFLQEKYKNARLALTNVTKAELMAEEATNNDPWGPDAKTMTKIAEASHEVDDYWRIVDVLHKRFDIIDWKEWRQSYKTMALLEFLLTHGPEEFAEEFQSDIDIIEELGKFEYIDEKGFNWGLNMQKRSDHLLELLNGGKTLKEERLKALRITKEIKGFGNVVTSPCSTSSPSSSTSDSSRTSSFYSSYSPTTPTFYDLSKPVVHDKISSPKSNHVWNCSPIQELGSLLDFEDDYDNDMKQDGSEILGINKSRKCYSENENFRSFSDVGRFIKKKYDRQFSIGY